MTLNLPDLTLAYALNDNGDHPDGGHCVGLPADDADRWKLLLDQHLLAFGEVADRGRELLDTTGDGWSLTRPVLFAAHHTCEVAIKFALVTNTGNTGPKSHKLDQLWARLRSTGGTARLSANEVGWVDDFIAEMQKLTTQGFDGRYPDTQGDMSEQWCCLRVPALQSAVTTFVALMQR